jgi:hypothetical protein
MTFTIHDAKDTLGWTVVAILLKFTEYVWQLILRDLVISTFRSPVSIPKPATGITKHYYANESDGMRPLDMRSMDQPSLYYYEHTPEVRTSMWVSF